MPTDEFVNEHVLNLEDKVLSEDGSIVTCSREGDAELGSELRRSMRKKKEPAIWDDFVIYK